MDQEDEENRESCFRSLFRRFWLFAVSILRHFVCCSNLGQELDSSQEENQVIPREQQQSGKPEARLLVLGASDTGKSTFMRNLRLDFGDQYPVEEMRIHLPHIRRNLFESVHKLVLAVANYNLSCATTQATEAAKRFFDWRSLEPLLAHPSPDPLWADSIETIWQDAAVQQAYHKRNEFHLMTNADYFITHAARILNQDYLPTVDDLLRMRFSTRSPVTKTYDLSNIRMTVQDMGGQRPERAEWLKQIVGNPSLILFMASLSEYDQTVEEAKEPKNRMQESLDIFDEVLGYAPFSHTPVIVMLNKTDIFSIKIKEQHNLETFFPDFTGSEIDEMGARDFITSMYEQVCRSHCKNLLVKYTDATDRHNFRDVFSYVNNYVSRCIISTGGLY